MLNNAPSIPPIATCSTLLLWALAGCAGSELAERADTTYAGPESPPTVAFEAAEYATGVPAHLLLAISKAETGLQMIEGHEEFPGQAPAYGVMALRGENVAEGARLAGLTEDEVRHDREANVLAAAHVLAAWGDQEGIDFADLDAWAPIVARYSGIEEDQAVAEYVHREVYGALEEGFAVEGVEIPPRLVAPDFPLPEFDALRTGDGGAIWTPSPNYNSRGGAAVDFVIIHTCEGAYSGCWGWLTNAASGVSAHYVVNDSGSEVRQLVDEDDRAWHIGANYDCDNNFGVECWRDGTSMNTISVGIEHAGYASQASWNSGLIQTSAELTCGITQRHGIPTDSYHVVGHGQLQPWNRTDPGANWPWTDYLNRVQDACGVGGGGGGSQFVIDSNNNANDTSRYYAEASGSWWSSANVAGYWNTGYYVAPMEPISDPAYFWFYADTAQCYSVDAWWTAAWDRATVSFIGWNASSQEVGRAAVDQSINGSKWNHLGDWNFSAGWNRVLLSRWGSSGYAIADAVRITECD